MAGITDTVFRRICKRFGADIVVSEMVSAEGLRYNSAATRSLLKFFAQERPLGVQLFGATPESLADAAKFIEDNAAPDFIDLNSGCPVSKVVRRNGGASLLKDKKLFEQILKAMVRSVSVPVTVKIRSGWNKYEWIDTEFARIAQDCGVAAITVHPRSQTMGFSGRAFRERIGEVKAAVSIPVIGNGDICSGEDARDMFDSTQCDSVMIGRAALGNPWIFGDIKAALRGEKYIGPTISERMDVVFEHIRLFAEEHGELRASKEMKKQATWYLKGLPGASSMRDSIFRSQSIFELTENLNLIFQQGANHLNG